MKPGGSNLEPPFGSLNLKTNGKRNPNPKRLKEMCINTKYSMSIIEKVFRYGETELSVIKCKDDIWFRGKTLAEVLGYSNPLKAIRMHIDSEDKKEMSELVYKGGAQHGHPFRNVQRGTIYVKESGLFALILRSQLESACTFKRWVTKDVLQSIHKTGRYDYCIDHKYNNTLTFKIENEMDLHVKVISFLKKRYPHSLFTVTLGEITKNDLILNSTPENRL